MQELGVSSALSIEARRAELAVMVERLSRSPRLANLLRYVGEKCLNGESDQIREYNIATEVFGRPETFDSNRDAIARVEAHRLRKKLKEYYELNGKDRPVQIVLPSGTYVPLFIQNETPTPVQNEAPEIVSEPLSGLKSASFRLWGAISAVAALLLLVLVIWVRTRSGHPAQPAALPVPRANPSEVIRVLAGYSGQPRISASGAVWGEDKYFQGGRRDRGVQTFIARTSDPFLFQTCRSGEFSYAVPVKPGVYELHLYFAENSYGPALGGGENDRTFAVSINGQTAIDSLDIESDAMGPDIADERVFKNIQPAADGKIHFALEGRRGAPIINAFEIIPGLPNRQLPVRLVMQPGSFIDSNGQLWNPDNYYLGGQTSIRRPAVDGTSDTGLYAMERYGHFTYAIPVDLRGTYTLSLHFAEYYFGPKGAGVGGLGSRRFNVMCNGVKLLDDFDIFREAGGLHAVTKTFGSLRPSPQGKLNLTFEPIANYATISAIEVVDESK
jgi:hypothetical protein